MSIDTSSTSAYGAASPSYPTAPLPDGGGIDPYASPAAFGSPGPGYAAGPGYLSGPGDGPPRPARRRGPLVALAVTAVVLLLVGIAAVGWFVWPGWGSDGDPAPTASPGTTTDPTDPADPTDPPSDTTQQGVAAGGEIVDGRMQGSGYSYAVPAGWTTAPESGEYDVGRTTDGADTTIAVYRMGSLASCQADPEALQTWAPGTLASLPDRDIAAAAATGTSLTGDDGDYYELYCATVGNLVYEISLQTTLADQAVTQPQFVAALDSWSWE